ncbi:MAG: acyltransferase [Holosporaceae bacterium]|jgi:peptidoglycan/LPS O-acetylase OafA/YrhL|nr:acyltransferase [Holosporaceae bacterium]
MKTKFFDDIERLRGFACILVLIQHIAWICPLRFIHMILPYNLLDGRGAVRIFFAISGFVITLSLKNKLGSLKGNVFLERIISAKELILSFYRKRFFRILPVVLFIAVLMGIYLYFTEEDTAWFPTLLRSLIEIFFGVYNNSVELFVSTEKIHKLGFGPFWTLAIEAQFYIFWPMVLLFCKNDNVRALVSLLSGLAFLFIISPWIAALYGLKYYLIYNNLSELFLGSFLAFLYQENYPYKPGGKCIKFISLIFAAIIWFYSSSMDDSFFSRIVPSLASIFVVALAVFAEGSFNVPVLGRLFDFLGSRSYSFYAVQLFLANVVSGYVNSVYFPQNAFSEYELELYQFGIFMVFLFVVTELVYRFIEKPFRKFGQK